MQIFSLWYNIGSFIRKKNILNRKPEKYQLLLLLAFDSDTT